MNIPDTILKEFKSIKDLTEFLEEAADGAQISAGKSPLDRSKDDKKRAEPGDQPEPNGDDQEAGVEQDPEVPPSGGEAPPPEGEAGAQAPAPGANISIGKKVIDKGKVEKESPVCVTGKEEKIDTKPKATTTDSTGM